MMKKLLLAALIALLPFGAEASNCSSNPFTLTNGQTADATQVMSNFNNLLNCANNNLAHNGANTDITSILGLTTPLSTFQGGTGVQSPTANTVLLGNGASPFQIVLPLTLGNVLSSSGGTWLATPPALFDLPVGAGVVNNTTPTTMFRFSVPGNTFDTSRSLHLTAEGFYINNSGAPANFQVSISYGGVILADTTPLAQATNASPRSINIDFSLFAVNSTAAQRAKTRISIGNGSGDLSAAGLLAPSFDLVGGVPSTVDTTVAQPLLIIFTHGTASVNIQASLSAASLRVQ